MSQITDSMASDPVTVADAGALNARILKAMCVSTIVALTISAALAPWRVTTGLMLGGALSILNYRWLHSSVASLVELNAKTQRAQWKSSRYLLRYLIVGTAVFISYQLQVVSLPATIAGLCAFVPALMFEAVRRFYLMIVHREESY